MPSRYYHNVRHEDLVENTRALAKFCSDHHSDETLFASILASLEADDFQAALRLLRANPPGPCTWADWFPPVVFEHEDPAYVGVLFHALTERWYRLMRTAAGEQK
jgi:hypothetical protein